jgi:hypothetical protein
MGSDMSYFGSNVFPYSAFGDQLTTDLKPVVSVKATYGLTESMSTFSATGGSVTESNEEFLCQTGTSVGGYGATYSAKPAIYIPGVGMEGRVTARFTTGVASYLQIAGMYTAKDGAVFGYNGTSFGVMHRYNGYFEVQTLTVTTASGGAATVTVTLNGTAYTASITSGTKAQNAHEITDGLNAGAAASLWYIQHINESVVFISKNAAAAGGSYSVSVSAGTFVGSISRNKAGAAPTETWTAKASWNVDTCTWLDPTKSNLYKVEYAYLGAGAIRFYVFNPTTDRFVLCHVIRWSNANTIHNLSNPSMRIGWAAASVGGSGTNITVGGFSGMIALQGRTSATRSAGANSTISGITTEKQVLSILVRREFGSRACLGVLIPKLLSIATDSTKGAVFTLYKNSTVAGVTIHQYIDSTNSIALYDVTGTTITGGTVLGVYSVGPSGRATISLADINNVLVPGDELIIAAKVTSGAASEMTTSLVWDEIY